VELAGGAITNGVVRIGDTVRRPVKPSSPRMREVLQHLEQVGFDAAPRWLGVDDEGRDILTWIEGETFVDRGRLHPFVDDTGGRILFSDEQVATAMRLLRRYHDAFGGEIICHGDYGPWNIVWRDDLPHALIDFDTVHPGNPSEDVAYALRMFIGYGLVDGDVVSRTRNALTAYGRDFDVPAILAREYARAESACRLNGWHRQVERVALERAWLEANASLF
jgi:Ser/Thr protein kinase RdoA (MazF antagonist)